MYPAVSPSQVLGTVVEGQVSHIEAPFFWLQREPDTVGDLCAGHIGDEEAGQAVGLKTEEHLAMKHNLQKTSTGRFWHERWFRKRVSGKPKWPLFSSVNFSS